MRYSKKNKKKNREEVERRAKEMSVDKDHLWIAVHSIKWQQVLNDR